MKRFKRTLLGLATLLILNTLTGTLDAQVTIGSGIAPTKGALLELKTQQANADNETTGVGGGGFILPRVKLQGLRTLKPLMTDAEATDELKKQLAGLMVYNLYTDNLPKPVLYPGVYIWDGESWGTSGINKSATPMNITGQPKAFSFYETGTETVVALEFSVDPPLDQEGNISGTISYQWFQVTGNNVHVRVGTKIGLSGTVTGTGANTSTFTPKGVLTGTTRNAKNTGFYKFYCEATANGATVTSDIAEVAVGCGAKNNAGDWLSFMCFNLGASHTNTLKNQMEYNIGTFTNSSNGEHTYISGEENLWGDLFQWGRIPESSTYNGGIDGHEKRQSEIKSIASGSVILPTNNIGGGNRCSSQGTAMPYLQVLKSSDWYRKFITSNATYNDNWNPLAASQIDGLWRTGRILNNDPCAHYRVDNEYQEFWHEGNDLTTNSPACTDSGTGWHIPSQDEWSSIYRGGTLSGNISLATANTWELHSYNSNKGLVAKPDGKTVTLYFPFVGYRSAPNGKLYNQGASSYYWSTSINGSKSYSMSFSSATISTASAELRGHGFAIRCIK